VKTHNFTIYFETSKNANVQSRLSVQYRTVARKSSIGGLYVCAGGLNVRAGGA